ncbi:MAG: serine/threonine protein kinase [Holophagaceae bacterium]|nr:serine/threonine protein kinase [Holophagaceae bacterium]
MSLDPTTIGRYRVLGTLGEGAMGVVYLAEDPRLKRGVAIKVVQGAALSRRDGLRRFQREAEISARLNHPNIVTVFDVGDEPGIGPFIAMERVEGESLRERLQRGPLAPEEAIPILGQLRSALEAAHRADIVHRDVKPDNLIITPDGRLKLMDFGIARDDDPSVTATAVYLGTPAYAAPELLAGQRASAATDRWAFAVTAFECIVGAAPFAGDTISATLFLIAHEAPRYPEGMAPGLKSVFQRAFDKEPLNRHPDLAAFMADLVEALPVDEETRTRARLQPAAPMASSQLPLPVIEAEEDRLARRRWVGLGAAAAVLLVAGAWAWLARAPRIISVESDPPGALVLVDGKAYGETPLRNLRIAAGTRRLRLEKKGHVALDHELGPAEKALVLKLEAAPYHVRVRTEPPGAQVFLDGHLKGQTPLENLEIPGGGTHALKVEKTGFVPWTAQLRSDVPLPDPIRLQKPSAARTTPKGKAEEPGKVKKFFSNLFKRKKG